MDLGLDEEQLRQNPSYRWRNRLKGAERSGLTHGVPQSPEDVGWSIDRPSKKMREKAFSGPAPALPKALCTAALAGILISQARIGEQAVGGMLVYRFGHAAECCVGWLGREGHKGKVGNFGCWETALERQRRGCRWLDLGEHSGSTGYGPFERGMRGVGFELLKEGGVPTPPPHPEPSGTLGS